jgi:hypothetical protein
VIQSFKNKYANEKRISIGQFQEKLEVSETDFDAVSLTNGRVNSSKTD